MRKGPGGAFSAQSGLAGTAPQVGWPSHQPAQQAVDPPRLHHISTMVLIQNHRVFSILVDIYTAI